MQPACCSRVPPPNRVVPAGRLARLGLLPTCSQPPPSYQLPPYACERLLLPPNTTCSREIPAPASVQVAVDQLGMGRRRSSSEQQPLIVGVIFIDKARRCAVVLAPCPHARRWVHIVLGLRASRLCDCSVFRIALAPMALHDATIWPLPPDADDSHCATPGSANTMQPPCA